MTPEFHKRLKEFEARKAKGQRILSCVQCGDVFSALRDSGETAMTDYTDLKARLRGAAHDERLSTGALYLDAHAAIEELEQRSASADEAMYRAYSDDFTGEIAMPSKESLLEDLRLLSNLERAHKMESNSLFIENGQLRKSLKDVLRMLEAAHRQSGIHGTDNKRIVAARSVLNAPPSLYAAPVAGEGKP